MKYNREELAWAAGLFDGEGSTSFRNGKKLLPILSIGQADPYVLERFRSAVGRGYIYGPFLSKRYPHRKPQWNYQSGNFENSQAALAAIWNWLSPQKRQQATKIFTAYYERLRTNPDARMGTGRCKRGHDLTLPDGFLMMNHGTRRRCRQCHVDYYANYAARKRDQRRVARAA